MWRRLFWKQRAWRWEPNCPRNIGYEFKCHTSLSELYRMIMMMMMMVVAAAVVVLVMIQTWPWRCYVSHSRRCWLLTSCRRKLLVSVLSVCQGRYHLVNVGARLWGWQALNHFLLTCNTQKSAYVHMLDSLYCIYPLGYKNFMLTSVPLWDKFLPGTQPVLQAQLLTLHPFPLVISWWLQILAWSQTTHSVSVRWSKNILVNIGFRLRTEKSCYSWTGLHQSSCLALYDILLCYLLTPEFLLGTVWHFFVLFAYNATLVLHFAFIHWRMQYNEITQFFL